MCGPRQAATGSHVVGGRGAHWTKDSCSRSHACKVTGQSWARVTAVGERTLLQGQAKQYEHLRTHLAADGRRSVHAACHARILPGSFPTVLDAAEAPDRQTFPLGAGTDRRPLTRTRTRTHVRWTVYPSRTPTHTLTAGRSDANAPGRLGDGSLVLVEEPVSYREKGNETLGQTRPSYRGDLEWRSHPSPSTVAAGRIRSCFDSLKGMHEASAELKRRCRARAKD